MNIDKNIPLQVITGRGRPAVYPYKDMDVGDSFFAEGQTFTGGAYQMANKHAKKTGKRFVGRKADGGIRIWRVE